MPAAFETPAPVQLAFDAAALPFLVRAIRSLLERGELVERDGTIVPANQEDS